MENLLQSFMRSFSCYINERHASEEIQSEGPPVKPRPRFRVIRPIIPNFTRQFTKSAKSPVNFDFSVSRDVFTTTQSDCGFDMIMEQLAHESQDWSMHIHKCTLSNTWVSVFLDRSHAFKQVLSATCIQSTNYGKHSQKSQTVVLASDMIPSQTENMDLSQLRVFMVKQTCKNLLNVLGYEVADIETENALSSPIKLFITNKSNELPIGYHRLLCGTVLNAKHNSKESQTTAYDYYMLRLEDLKTISRHRHGSNMAHLTDCKDTLHNLQDAAIKVDFLCIQPGRTLTINLDPNSTCNRVTTTKGAAFVMYNCARIAEILKKYHIKEAEGYYPSMMKIEDIDFSLLNKEVEWQLLFNFVLRYPTVIEESVAGVNEGNLRPDFVCTFVMAMCSSFSVYYRQTRILTEPRQQLLPTMFARLYLLLGIQQVLHNALRVIGIAPISQKI